MNSLDIGIIVIASVFLGWGVWIGFIRQLASLLALFFGYLIAGHYYEQFGPLLGKVISSPQLCFLITYVLIFVAVFLLVTAAGFLLKKVASLSLMGWFDRLLGGIFGLFKAAVVLTVLFMVIAGFLINTHPFLTRSFFAPYLGKSSAFSLSFVRDRQLHRHLLPSVPAITASTSVPARQPLGAQATKKTK